MIQKARIRTAWKNSNTERSVAEFASALSAIVWRISLNAAKNLHQEDFEYTDDTQRLGVVFEYVCFLCHVSDRLTFDRLDDQQPLPHAQQRLPVVLQAASCLSRVAQVVLRLVPAAPSTCERVADAC